MQMGGETGALGPEMENLAFGRGCVMDMECCVGRQSGIN